MSWSGWEALPDVREWSTNTPGCPRLVGRFARISGSGRETIPDDRKWWGGPPGCPEVVGRPAQMYGSGREALFYVYNRL